MSRSRSLPAAVLPATRRHRRRRSDGSRSPTFPRRGAGRGTGGARRACTGAAALLPPGTRALAVPDGPGTPPLRVGDTVDVLATYDPFLFDPASGRPVPAGDTVVAGALVIDVSEGAITVAVDPDDAPAVAFALAQGAVTLALAG